MAKFTAEERIKNERENWKARQRALELAKRKMAKEGFVYPVYDPSMPIDTYYTAIREYGETESRYMHEFLLMPSGPRPVIEYPKEKEYKDWHDTDN
jgi:hypothetical protein